MTATMDVTDSPSSGVGYRTVAARAKEWSDKLPDAVAMREKDFGIWQEVTWGDYWEVIVDAAHGLLALGVDVGDRVAIHSEDRPEWLILDIATVAIRGHYDGSLSDEPGR